MLVTARTAGLILLLLFVLVTGNLSISYLVQGGDKYAPINCKQVVVSERKSFQISSEKKTRGRKMVSSHDFMKMATTKEIEVRAKDQKKPRILISRENYGARFVAFNADYKGPRHHPPKNN